MAMEEYSEALANLEKIKSEAEEMVREFAKASGQLSDSGWKRLSFSGINVSFPPGIASGLQISANRIASVKEIGEKASQYHTALQKAQDLWRQIPETQRQALRQVEP